MEIKPKELPHKYLQLLFLLFFKIIFICLICSQLLYNTSESDLFKVTVWFCCKVAGVETIHSRQIISVLFVSLSVQFIFLNI